ncbi:uncharacterized protein LOC127080229 [Lathyrus oleraceus]|uniref:uncharacterized protein LOC127080229 n=1 Tax=Pisum sativum TaxID=3888 RepID=UPI0021D0FC99|nr:uncharacterized protein LOC127080229 [Pisum sativum]
MQVFPDHILGDLEEKINQHRDIEEVNKKKKGKKQKKVASSGAPVASRSGMPKENNVEKPRKKARKDKKPKQVNTSGVPEGETTRKNEKEERSVVEESHDEDERTLKELLTQVAKDKKEMMVGASVRVQDKKSIEEEEEKVGDNKEEVQDDKIHEEENEDEKIDDDTGSEKDANEEVGNDLNGQWEGWTIAKEEGKVVKEEKDSIEDSHKFESEEESKEEMNSDVTYVVTLEKVKKPVKDSTPAPAKVAQNKKSPTKAVSEAPNTSKKEPLPERTQKEARKKKKEYHALRKSNMLNA